MLTDSIIALLISFAVCAALCPVMIPVLHRMKFGQEVRDDGPQAHLKKKGTPTMGGIMIVAAVIVGTLPFAAKYPLVRPVLIFTVVYGIIGFLDDYLKVVVPLDGIIAREVSDHLGIGFDHGKRRPQVVRNVRHEVALHHLRSFKFRRHKIQCLA